MQSARRPIERLCFKVASVALVAMLLSAAGARAEEPGASTFLLSGFGTAGLAHSSEYQADVTNSPYTKPSGAGYSHRWSAEVVAVVSARSPVNVLSKDQIADIFLGKTVHFPDGERAVPIDQTEGSAARDEFYTRYAGKSAVQMKAHWSKIIFTGRGQPPKEVSTSLEVKKRLVEDPNAIGYIEKTLADGSVRLLYSP